MVKTNRMLIFISILLTLSILVACEAPEDNGVDENGEAEAPQEEENVMDTDVLVVGGGGAGLAAAIEASEEGASVVLVEKLGMLGGSTSLSGGILHASESPVQERAGIEEPWEDFADYWMEMSEGNADEEMINYIARNSGETIAWLEERGVVFQEDLTAEGISPAQRGHHAEDGGFGITRPLEEVAEDLGVEIILNTTVTELILEDDGTVIGAVGENGNGQTFTFNAEAVILATGGFDQNEEMIEEYAPVASGQFSYAASGNVGDGLRMAEEAGADIVAPNGVIGFRGVDPSVSYRGELGGLVFAPNLYVDESGQRFMNEADYYALMYEAMVENESEEFYSIFSGEVPEEILDEGVEEGYAVSAESFEELAEAIGVPEENFLNTIERFNELVEIGEDEDYGNPAIAEIEENNLYALTVHPATLSSFGGPRVNLQGEVLDSEGNHIGGLYAAGDVANGQLYDSVYPASGTCITSVLVMGREAGKTAAMSVE
ncbi:FAD-dependent oxidoreductase [Isachenkonia alkalipeptolytica]|uniref:FAD-dependent oxidoreductase n=1 Tax=Isachenkonia alkalipeptolytica TaxID=2565777 RepID=A0AA43XM85_9CLOT|nr:FAD-dependent oxidoreductase [Isachenkonia alkalipeptolytica]NBG89423.1 FAD-dependent oxidoreductase [Isachenkonia alkalipeptolytica]